MHDSTSSSLQVEARRAAPGQALSKGPKSNNSPTKGLLTHPGLLLFLFVAVLTAAHVSVTVIVTVRITVFVAVIVVDGWYHCAVSRVRLSSTSLFDSELSTANAYEDDTYVPARVMIVCLSVRPSICLCVCSSVCLPA